jgi:hypothetical protein
MVAQSLVILFAVPWATIRSPELRHDFTNPLDGGCLAGGHGFDC